LILGQAGVDFPVLASVPETGFNCNTQKFPGIYADQDADCQAREQLPLLIRQIILNFENITGLSHVPTQWKLRQFPLSQWNSI